jgi:integrase
MARNSLLAYGSDLNQFFEWFDKSGPGSLNAIDLKALSAYLAHLHERGLSSTTVARHLVSIKMFFRYLLLEGVIRESVVDLISSPKLWQHLPHVLSPDMVNRLLAAPEGADRFMLRDRALLALLYATGCRASEVVNLKLRDVHLDESYCRCVGKGNKERLVPMGDQASDWVERYQREGRPAGRMAHLECARRLDGCGVGVGSDVAAAVPQFRRAVPHGRQDQMGLLPVEGPAVEHVAGLHDQHRLTRVVQEVFAELVPEQPAGGGGHTSVGARNDRRDHRRRRNRR